MTNRIVFYSVGINKYNVGKNYKTLHAEVDVLIKFIKKLKKITSITSCRQFTLCVITTNKKGNILRHSECCENCINYIKKFNNRFRQYKISINKIYYIDICSNIQSRNI